MPYAQFLLFNHLLSLVAIVCYPHGVRIIYNMVPIYGISTHPAVSLGNGSLVVGISVHGITSYK